MVIRTAAAALGLLGESMRKQVVALALAGVFVTSSAALADGASQASDVPKTQAPPAASDNSSNDNEMICRREHITGSLLPGPKICKSRKIWEQQQQDSKDWLNNATQRTLESNPKGG